MNAYEQIRAALALVREPYGTAGHAELQIALLKLAELERAAGEPAGYVFEYWNDGWCGDGYRSYKPDESSEVRNIEPRYAAPPIPNAAAATQLPDWYGMDTPWPLHDVLSRLIGATGILLDNHMYDGHGHEGIRYAQDAAKEILAKMMKDAPAPSGNESWLAHYKIPPPAIAAAPQPQVAVTDEMCERVSRAFDAMPIRAIHREYGRDMIAAVQSELGPQLGLAVWREPTPEECERIADAYFGAEKKDIRVGVRMFQAVREVMGGGE